MQGSRNLQKQGASQAASRHASQCLQLLGHSRDCVVGVIEKQGEWQVTSEERVQSGSVMEVGGTCGQKKLVALRRPRVRIRKAGMISVSIRLKRGSHRVYCRCRRISASAHRRHLICCATQVCTTDLAYGPQISCLGQVWHMMLLNCSTMHCCNHVSQAMIREGDSNVRMQASHVYRQHLE